GARDRTLPLRPARAPKPGRALAAPASAPEPRRRTPARGRALHGGPALPARADHLIPPDRCSTGTILDTSARTFTRPPDWTGYLTQWPLARDRMASNAFRIEPRSS